MTHPFHSQGPAGGRLSDDDAARLSEQIAGLTSAGLPLAPGLRATAEEMPRGRLRATFDAIAGAMERGATLDEAVAGQGSRLPPHLRGLVLIGSRSGKLGQVLGRFVTLNNVGSDLRRRITLSLAYPVLAITLAFTVITFISTALVGSYATIFRDFGIPLPRVTVAVMGVARLFDVSWLHLGELLAGLLMFAVLARVLLGPDARRSLLAAVPVLGSVWRNTSLAEFCHLLALLLECEVPLGQAVRLTGGGVSDASIDRACAAMGTDVEAGLSLSQAVKRRRVFPAGLARVLKWAEGHQSLPETLHMAGEMFESRARTLAGFAGTVLGVVSMLLIWFGIATVVVGLLLPMIVLLSKLAG